MRALVVAPDERVLLVRFELPRDDGMFVLWAAPGGGIEPGEDELVALRRELAEEIGLIEPAIGPCVWTRTHWFPMTNHDGQEERFHLVRTGAFDPAPHMTEEQLRAEGVTGMRWWTPTELASSEASFAPSRLPALLSALLREGPGDAPIDVGI